MGGTVCHDCGVREGEIHRLGCDMEQCPFCGGQLISCFCQNLGAKEQFEAVTAKGRIPYILFPNLCARCGKLWPEMFMVPDTLWRKYIPGAKSDEMLCLACWRKIVRLICNARNVKPEKEALWPQMDRHDASGKG